MIKQAIIPAESEYCSGLRYFRFGLTRMMRLDREFWDGLGQGGQSGLVILHQLPRSAHHAENGFDAENRSGETES